MAQINLLKQNSNFSNNWEVLPKLVVRFLIVVLVALVVYYVWLYISLATTKKTIISTKTDIETKKATSLNVVGRSEVLTRQQQIAALNEVIGGHLYWSKILPKIAEATLKKATYSSLRVGDAGSIVLSVNVPDLESLDEYLQVFNLPEIYKNFSDVSIGGYHKVQGKDSTSIAFEVNMKFNPSLVQYEESN